MVNNKLNQMYRIKNRVFYGFLLVISDFIALTISGILSYYLRFYLDYFGNATYVIDREYLVYILAIALLLIVILFVFKAYDINYAYRGFYFYPKSMFSIFLTVIIIYYAARLISDFYFSRFFIGLFLIISVILLFGSRFLVGIITKKIFKAIGIPYEGLDVNIRDFLIEFKDKRRLSKKLMYGFFLVLNDIFFLSIAFYLSFYLRFNTGFLGEVEEVFYIENNYVFYSILFILSAVSIFSFFRLYNWDRIYRGSGYYSRIIKGIIINIIVIILAGYIFELFTFSRKWILLLFILSVLFIFFSRFFIEFISIKSLKKISGISKSIVLGIGEDAKRIEDSFEKYSLEGDKVLGFVDYRAKIKKNKEYSKSFNILGYIEDLKRLIIESEIQRVIIVSSEFKYDVLLDILEELKSFDISVLIFPGFFEFSIKRVDMREIAGIPLMQVSNIGFSGINLFLKNTIDYIFGLIIFILFIPIYLIVGSAIKINSPGPVFYKQKRLTKNSKFFYMYKFRSMYIDADERLKDLEEYNEADGPLFKMKRDPRITKVGRFIRRFSIDELPQIINVLRGELSLVGPRPPIPKEIEQYEDWQHKRLNVKQGITGLWQVSGRSELSFEEMARLDLYYIQNWSIEMDIKILLKTIPTVLFGKGAY